MLSSEAALEYLLFATETDTDTAVWKQMREGREGKEKNDIDKKPYIRELGQLSAFSVQKLINKVRCQNSDTYKYKWRFNLHKFMFPI